MVREAVDRQLVKLLSDGKTSVAYAVCVAADGRSDPSGNARVLTRLAETEHHVSEISGTVWNAERLESAAVCE